MPKRRKARNKGDTAKLEMTPMIDVVFQLLIFFIVTLKETDILSNLNVSRPAPDSTTPPDKQVDDLLTIQIGKEGWVVNGAPYIPRTFATLDKNLTRLASFNRGSSVIIKCTGDSPHSYLIRILNILAREKMTNISVFSL
jgi:biopolymer transport protein ExbD